MLLILANKISCKICGKTDDVCPAQLQ